MGPFVNTNLNPTYSHSLRNRRMRSMKKNRRMTNVKNISNCSSTIGSSSSLDDDHRNMISNVSSTIASSSSLDDHRNISSPANHNITNNISSSQPQNPSMSGSLYASGSFIFQGTGSWIIENKTPLAASSSLLCWIAYILKKCCCSRKKNKKKEKKEKNIPGATVYNLNVSGSKLGHRLRCRA